MRSASRRASSVARYRNAELLGSEVTTAAVISETPSGVSWSRSSRSQTRSTARIEYGLLLSEVKSRRRPMATPSLSPGYLTGRPVGSLIRHRLLAFTYRINLFAVFARSGSRTLTVNPRVHQERLARAGMPRPPWRAWGEGASSPTEMACSMDHMAELATIDRTKACPYDCQADLPEHSSHFTK